MNTEEFIERAKNIHGNKYDYSKVEYKRNDKKVCIICPKHGEFWQTPKSHLRGADCSKCYEERRGKNRQYSLEDFIAKAKSVHGDKYDYSKVEYIDSKTKVCIICKEHGEFLQTPAHHLQGQGCKLCNYDKSSKEQRKSKEDFIKDAIKIHGNKYDYSKVDYLIHI